jgi:hypothetical protein
MPSPTDLPSAVTPPDDLDLLLGAAIETAARMLREKGEFYPFAMAVDSDGDLLAPEIAPEDAHPTPEHVLGLLVEALRGASDGLRAAVLCADVRLADRDSDAIRVDLEPRDGEPMTVFVPYAPGPELDEPFGVQGMRRVFA